MYKKKPTARLTAFICQSCGNNLKCFELNFSSLLCCKCIGKKKQDDRNNGTISQPILKK